MKQVRSLTRREGAVGGDHKGAVVVELAVILPFLVFLFLIIADLGLVLREHQIIANAAREGARYSSLEKNWVDPRNPSASLAAIQQHVVDYCAEEGITVSTGDVTVNQGASFVVNGVSVSASEVTVFVNRRLLVPLSFSGSSVDLRARATFRNFHAGS